MTLMPESSPYTPHTTLDLSTTLGINALDTMYFWKTELRHTTLYKITLSSPPEEVKACCKQTLHPHRSGSHTPPTMLLETMLQDPTFMECGTKLLNTQMDPLLEETSAPRECLLEKIETMLHTLMKGSDSDSSTFTPDKDLAILSKNPQMLTPGLTTPQSNRFTRTSQLTETESREYWQSSWVTRFSVT